MWWDQLIQDLGALAIPTLLVAIVGAYVTYLYTDRAKRLEFRRSALFERKLAAYQQTISTAKWFADLLVFISKFKTPEEQVKPLLEHVPEEQRAEASRKLEAFFSIFRRTVFRQIVASAGWKTDIESYPELKEFPPEGVGTDVLEEFVRFSELAMHASSEFERAVTRLKLLGCPQSLLDSVDSLGKDLMEKAQGGDEEDFEDRVRKHIDRLTTAMHADLEATMAGS